MGNDSKENDTEIIIIGHFLKPDSDKLLGDTMSLEPMC